jgi:hypothetical protein
LDRAFGKLKIMRNLAVIGLCTTALFFYFQPAKNGDIDWSPSIRTDLAVVQYCEQAGLRDRHIFTTSVLRIDFHEPYAGYLSGRPFGNVQSEFTNETEYCIFSGDESGGELLNTIRSNNHLELMRRFTEKYAWREIYRVVR